MTTMIDVEVGDTVMVVQPHHDSREDTVTKAGRVWITVDEGWQEKKFRRDTQTDGSGIGVSARFYTLTQWAEKQQRDEVTAYLREQGIDLRHDSPWVGREAKLAAILQAAGAEEA